MNILRKSNYIKGCSIAWVMTVNMATMFTYKCIIGLTALNTMGYLKNKNPNGHSSFSMWQTDSALLLNFIVHIAQMLDIMAICVGKIYIILAFASFN